jgi:hypothetical protein
VCGLVASPLLSDSRPRDSSTESASFIRQATAGRASAAQATNVDRDSGPARSPNAWVVARVDGEPIELTEFRDAMEDERAGLIQYYSEASHKSALPTDALRRRALDSLVSRKLVQLLMKRNGLVSDITYSAFLARWKAENRRRSEATAAGKPVYGPLTLSPRDFFSYEFSNNLRELKRILQHDDDRISFEDRLSTLRANATVDIVEETYRSATID